MHQKKKKFLVSGGQCWIVSAVRNDSSKKCFHSRFEAERRCAANTVALTLIVSEETYPFSSAECPRLGRSSLDLKTLPENEKSLLNIQHQMFRRIADD